CSAVPEILNTSTSSDSCPDCTSNAIRRSDVSFFTDVAVVSQTRPPATTGDDQPRPGTAVFQATLFVSLHSIGSPCSVECPWPPGPRNCGQSSVARDTACASHNSASIVAPNRIAESLPPSGGQVCKRALCGVRPAKCAVRGSGLQNRHYGV